MNSAFTIHSVSWADAQHDLIAVRTQVFMHEQQVSTTDEWDGKDSDAAHIIARTADGTAVGCARILVEMHANQLCCHIGRVAVLKNQRNKGLGVGIMHSTLTWCQQQHPSKAIFLHAQISRVAFYQRLNFVSQGAVFIDAGIPHIEMWYKNIK